VYRCYIIWNSRWYVIALPALMYLASSGTDIIRCISMDYQLIVEPLTFFFAAFAILVLLLSALPHLPVPSTLRGTLQNSVQWVSLSVSLNIVVTSMICFRLLRMRALLRQVLDSDSEMSRMYTNIAAMLVESSAPLSIIGIGILITSVNNGSITYAFGYVWTMSYVSFVTESSRVVMSSLTEPFFVVRLSPRRWSSCGSLWAVDCSNIQ
jgi:hypothetical protein